MGGYLDERYDDKGLVQALERYLGDTAAEASTVPLLLTAYDLERARHPLPALGGRGTSATMVDAAHATSAAPTYFEPVRLDGATLVDGGVFAINPAVCAYAEVAGKPDLLLSLGTGQHTRPLPYKKVKDWGRLEWAAAADRRRLRRRPDAVDCQLDSARPGAPTSACRPGSSWPATTSTTPARRTSPTSPARPSS